ncbi:MAG: molybdate ABC transporter permease subunit [Lachnospiraceae bacterium]|nr:molybdate ABC transporter permease subunit [Lachnospiraceae bacterium]
MDYTPIIISVRTVCVSIVVTVILGLAAAKLVVSLKTRWLRTVLDGIFTLPLVLPPTVAGFLLLYIFGVKRPFGKFLAEVFGVKVPFSWAATVLAAVVVSFPLMYRASRGAIEQVDPELAESARSMGANEWVVFTRVTIPVAGPGILTGIVLAFVRGLGEFGATTMIAGNISGKTRTLPLAVYSEVAAGNMDTAGVYVLLLAAISFLAVVALNIFGDRRGITH